MSKTALKKKVKYFLRKHFFKDQPGDRFDGKHPFELDHTPVGYLRSFGKCNPDKIFYVIWRESSFFSSSGIGKNVVRMLKYMNKRRKMTGKMKTKISVAVAVYHGENTLQNNWKACSIRPVSRMRS